jgi:hypothetical protein
MTVNWQELIPSQATMKTKTCSCLAKLTRSIASKRRLTFGETHWGSNAVKDGDFRQAQIDPRSCDASLERKRSFILAAKATNAMTTAVEPASVNMSTYIARAH